MAAPERRGWRSLNPVIGVVLCLLGTYSGGSAEVLEVPVGHTLPKKYAPWHMRMTISQDEFLTACSDTTQAFPMSLIPLSYSSLGQAPKERLLTKESASTASTEHWYRGRWPDIAEWLPERSEDVFDSWDTSSCAVVGNSGNLLHTLYGDDIDQHGSVFRMNRAQAVGYEQYVGSKTTVRLLNRYHSELYASNGTLNERWKDMPNSQIMPMERDVTLLLTRAGNETLLQCLKNISNLRQADQRQDVTLAVLSHRSIFDALVVLDLYRQCHSLHSQRSSKHIEHLSPSSGLVLALWTLQFCDHVSIYGIGYPPRTADTPYQYYLSRNVANHIHDFSAEMHMFQSLADAGLITLCSPNNACHGKKLPFKSHVPFSRSKALANHLYNTEREWSEYVNPRKISSQFVKFV